MNIYLYDYIYTLYDLIIYIHNYQIIYLIIYTNMLWALVVFRNTV